MKKILVTGGCGFVGRHLIKRLLSLGDNDIWCVDNFSSTSSREPISWMKHLHLSENESMRFHLIPSNVEDIFKTFLNQNFSFNEIFHLSAVVGGRNMIDKQPLEVATDLSIDASFWNYVSKLRNNPKIHYFSSSAAYGIDLQTKDSFISLNELDLNIKGDYIHMPDMTYGWAKLTGEYLAKICYERYGHDITVYRPFSGYGEDQDLSYPFPALLKKVMNAGKYGEIEVWGTGEQVRDFIYIEDCIDGILHLGTQIHDASPVNLSTGYGTSFNNLIRQINIELFGELTEFKLKRLEEKPVGVMYRVGDTTLQNKLGFKAKTNLSEGVRKCIDYTVNHNNENIIF